MINTCTVKITESDNIPENAIRKCAFTVCRNGEVKTIFMEGRHIFPMLLTDVVCGSTFFVTVPCHELTTGFNIGAFIDGDGETEILQAPLNGEVMNVTLFNGVGTM